MIRTFLFGLLLAAAFLAITAATAVAQPEDTTDVDETDYGAVVEDTSANSTNHQSKVLRQNGLKDYSKGQIDFELLDLTRNALDEDPDYPAELEALDGKTVEFLGFMTPYDSIDEFKRFMLVNFPTGCNFCAIPRLQEIVFVQVDLAKKPPPFIDGITKVRGTLHLKKTGRAFEIEGWLPEEKHDVFKEFIFVISDVKATAFDPKKTRTTQIVEQLGGTIVQAPASSEASQPAEIATRPPWFKPAVAGVLLTSVLVGLLVFFRQD